MLSTNFRYLIYAILCILFFGAGSFLVVLAQGETEPIQLEKIIVTPGRFTIYDGASARLSLSKPDIERFPLIDNDVMRAAHIFPGVVSSDYSARFSVRGGEKDDISVRLDGMELYNPYHLQDFGGAVSLVGLDLIQRTELLIGGFPAEYGEKMSGVFDITTKTPKTEKLSANFGLDLINATAMIEGPFSKKGGWILSVRRGYVDLILALMNADEKYKPQYADIYGKLEYQLTQADTLTFNGLYGWDTNRIRGEGIDNDLDSRYDNSTAWTRWRRTFGTSSWTDVFVFAGTSRQDRATGRSDFDNRDFRFLGAKAEFTSNIFQRHTFRSGIAWRWLAAQYQYNVQERQAGINVYNPILADVDERGSEFKVFLQDEWQFHPRLAFNVGGRYVAQSYRETGIQSYEIGPRIALALKPTKNLVLRSAWGIYHQPVHLMGLPVEDGVETVGRAEQAVHYILGAEYAPTNNFLLHVEAYYNTFANLAGRMREFGRQDHIFVSPESGHAKGVDLFVTHAISNRLTWTVGYTYAIAKEQVENETIFRQYDRRHSFALSSSHQLSPAWYLYLSWRFHTGEPTTPLIHKETRLPTGGIACERQFGDTRSDRLPAYHSLDFRITKQSPYRRWEMTWYFQILNLYNHTNVDHYAFSEIQDEKTGAVIDCVIEEEPLFPIVPTLGITVAF